MARAIHLCFATFITLHRLSEISPPPHITPPLTLRADADSFGFVLWRLWQINALSLTFIRIFHENVLISLFPVGMDEVTTSVAVADDVAELHEFMLDDFLREPSINAAIGLTRQEAKQCYRGIQRKQGRCLLALHLWCWPLLLSIWQVVEHTLPPLPHLTIIDRNYELIDLLPLHQYGF